MIVSTARFCICIPSRRWKSEVQNEPVLLSELFFRWSAWPWHCVNLGCNFDRFRLSICRLHVIVFKNWFALVQTVQILLFLNRHCAAKPVGIRLMCAHICKDLAMAALGCGHAWILESYLRWGGTTCRLVFLVDLCSHLDYSDNTNSVVLCFYDSK